MSYEKVWTIWTRQNILLTGNKLEKEREHHICGVSDHISVLQSKSLPVTVSQLFVKKNSHVKPIDFHCLFYFLSIYLSFSLSDPRFSFLFNLMETSSSTYSIRGNPPEEDGWWVVVLPWLSQSAILLHSVSWFPLPPSCLLPLFTIKQQLVSVRLPERT